MVRAFQPPDFALAPAAAPVSPATPCLAPASNTSESGHIGGGRVRNSPRRLAPLGRLNYRLPEGPGPAAYTPRAPARSGNRTNNSSHRLSSLCSPGAFSLLSQAPGPGAYTPTTTHHGACVRIGEAPWSGRDAPAHTFCHKLPSGLHQRTYIGRDFESEQHGVNSPGPAEYSPSRFDQMGGHGRGHMGSYESCSSTSARACCASISSPDCSGGGPSASAADQMSPLLPAASAVFAASALAARRRAARAAPALAALPRLVAGTTRPRREIAQTCLRRVTLESMRSVTINLV